MCLPDPSRLPSARAYQDGVIATLVERYSALPTVAADELAGRRADGSVFIPAPARSPRSATGQVASDYLVADLDAACDYQTIPLRLRYEASDTFVNFSETLGVRMPEQPHGTVRAFFPSYSDVPGESGRGGFRYAGMEIEAPLGACLKSIRRIADTAATPLLLFLTVPPDWRDAGARHQTFLSDHDDVHVYTAPANLSVPRRVPARSLQDAFGARPSFRAPIVNPRGDGWVIDGKADDRYTYLLSGPYRHLGRGARLRVSGTLRHGGFSIGLLQDERWARQVTISARGPFRIEIEVPEAGDFAAVVANYLPGSLENSFDVGDIGFVEPPRPPAGVPR